MGGCTFVAPFYPYTLLLAGTTVQRGRWLLCQPKHGPCIRYMYHRLYSHSTTLHFRNSETSHPHRILNQPPTAHLSSPTKSTLRAYGPIWSACLFSCWDTTSKRSHAGVNPSLHPFSSAGPRLASPGQAFAEVLASDGPLVRAVTRVRTRLKRPSRNSTRTVQERVERVTVPWSCGARVLCGGSGNVRRSVFSLRVGQGLPSFPFAKKVDGRYQ